jgi:hypothetical protein
MKHGPHYHAHVDDKRNRKNEGQEIIWKLANQVTVGDARITAITSCCHKKDIDMKHHCFAFGTHNGLIYIATVVMSASSTSTNENAVVELGISNKIELLGGPMVNALCCLAHSDGSTTLVIGHSLGLATIELFK